VAELQAAAIEEEANRLAYELLAPADVVWSLTRAGAKDSANPISFIWSKIVVGSASNTIGPAR